MFYNVQVQEEQVFFSISLNLPETADDDYDIAPGTKLPYGAPALSVQYTENNI